jgi:hypothetical protein
VKPVYIVSTKSGQYVCEVFEHREAGFVWDVNGKRINYAVPTGMRGVIDRVTFQVRRSFGDDTLKVEAL